MGWLGFAGSDILLSEIFLYPKLLSSVVGLFLSLPIP
jgi:hypothetical protein